MFKTNSNSDHTLKMTAQVAQINVVRRKEEPLGWRKEVDETVISDTQERSV